MKALKVLLWSIGLLLLLIMILFAGLNNARFLDKTAQFALEKSGMDIKIAAIKGGLFSGLYLQGFNYQDDVKADLKLDMDFQALGRGILDIHELNVSNLHIDKDFLSSMLSSKKSTQQESTGKSFLKKIKIDNFHIDANDIHYEAYHVDRFSLDAADFSYDMNKNISANIQTKVLSNVANANGHIDINESRYDAVMQADVAKDFIIPYLGESNVTLYSLPHISLRAKGDLSDAVVDVKLLGGQLKANAIMIDPKTIDLHADIGLKSALVKAVLGAEIDSAIAKADLAANTAFNMNDINQTLQFRAKSHIIADAASINQLAKEHNITVTLPPEFTLSAKGDLKNISLQTSLKEGEIRYGGFEVWPKALDLDAMVDLQKNLLDATLHSQINSNAADVDFNSTLSLNLLDINQSLKYTSTGMLKPQSAYLHAQLPESNITLDKLSGLSLVIQGDAKALDATVNLSGEMGWDALKAQPQIKDTTLHVDLKKQDIKAQLHAAILSNKGDIALDSDVGLNLKDINDSLTYTASMNLKNAKAYKGVNLSSLGDILLDAKGSLKALQAKLQSKKINADIASSDFDTFKLQLETQKLKLAKLYTGLPDDFKNSSLALRGKGYYIRSLDEAKLKAKLQSLHYNNRTISSNEFTFEKKKEDIKLSPLTIKSKNFKLTLDADKKGDRVVAHLKNKAVYASATVVQNPLGIQADGTINSIEALLKEVDKIYPVDTGMGIDGKVKFKVRTKADRVKAQITSPAISLPKGKMQKLNIVALYEPHLIRIKNFDFDLAGFERKEMNRPVRLAREGVITFNDENASVDFALKNILSFKGKKVGDVSTGALHSKNLLLAYPEYGTTTVSTDLEMFESKGKTAVTGTVRFKETEVNYQSRFLDISKDEDIILISKNDKQKEESDSFLQNIFLDIKVLSDDEILYKVDDGEIEMQPDINIRKEFGQTPKITGKIKILDGMYDFADKRFVIKEGAVAFRGLKEVNPLLDLHVEYDEIEDIIIMIDIGGDKNRPKLKFSSTPQKSKKDIFSYLLFGMSASETEGAATSANKAAEKIFGRAVAKDLARELHLDRLDMNRNADGGVDIKAGKKVKRKMIIYYQNKATESSVIVERKLNKHWEVDTEVGKLGQSVDFVYRKGFK